MSNKSFHGKGVDACYQLLGVVVALAALVLAVMLVLAPLYLGLKFGWVAGAAGAVLWFGAAYIIGGLVE